MNFVDAEFDATGAAVRLDRTQLPLARTRPGEAGRPVILGIRPEDLELGSQPDLALDVDGIEALGADTVVHGRLGSGAKLSVRLDGARLPRSGDRLSLQVEPINLHLFSMVDGRRMPD